MADIHDDFSIRAPAERVFEAVSTPEGLDAWWTRKSAGHPVLGVEYQLDFGPNFEWIAVVSRCTPYTEFELAMTRSDDDWTGTRVGFLLDPKRETTHVHFYHSGWLTPNTHYRISCFCWAMYLRLLKRYVEHGEIVAFERRLDA